MSPARTLSRRSAEVRDSEASSQVTVRLFKNTRSESSADEEVRRAVLNSLAIVDPFNSTYGGMNTGAVAFLQPEYNPYALLKLPNECSALRQCVDAMVTNICSFGYRLEYVGPADQEDSAAAKAEKDRIEGLTSQPNGEISFTEMRERFRRDLETFGYGFYEIGRQTLGGDISYIGNMPSQTVRMTAKYPEFVDVEMLVMRNGKMVKIKMKKRFRRFVQMVGSSMVYYKEFGDPRMINPKDGKVVKEGDESGITFENSANEIYHFMLHSPGSAYGVPRWVANLPSVLGIRECELTNLQFFKDNAIPAMAVLVSGGALTNSSISNIENQFTDGRGRESMNRVLVIEASGDENSGSIDSTVPAPRIDLKPLTSERQTDGSFLEYGKECARKIRSAWRLPPIFVGYADDYTRATADASVVVADTQVFGPERNKEDDMFNSHFFTVDQQPLKYWNLKTNPPRLVSPDDVLKALKQLDASGALTPNVVIGIANELFDMKLTKIEQGWGDFPFAIVVNLARAGNLDGVQGIMIDEFAGVATGTEGNAGDPNKKPKPANSNKKPKSGNTSTADPKAKPGKPANSDKEKTAASSVKKEIEEIIVGNIKKLNDTFVQGRQRSTPVVIERTRTRD